MITVSENTGKKQGGRFAKGTSGNPKGKPKGTRHKTTLAIQALLDGEAEAITRKAIALAMEGDSTAMRLVLERILPPRKDRPVAIDLPTITKSEDIVNAISAIVAAVANGEITPDEGHAMTVILESLRKSIETQELEKRIVMLETTLEKRK